MPNYITHTFIASKYSKNPSYIFGTLIADMEHVFLLRNKGHNEHIGIEKLIRILKKDKKFKALALGLHHHIRMDNFAHKKFIVPLAKKIAKELDIKENRAHGLLEFAFAHKIIKVEKGFFKKFKKIIETRPHVQIKKQFA